jgi:mRNA interferase MazF
LVIQRGQIYWIDLGDIEDHSSRPAGQRPIIIIQNDILNESDWGTTVVAALTSNLTLGSLPGAVLLPAALTGLPKESIVNPTALWTIDKSECQIVVATLPLHLMQQVDAGLQFTLGLRQA